MSETIIAAKAKVVAGISEQFKAAKSAVVVNYRGLTVAQVTELRKELRDAGVKMEVIKNTYLRRAADANGYEDLDAVFFEKRRGHAVAGGEAAGERAVVDLAAAAARAALFQDGRFAAVEPGQMQRLLRPAAKLRGHVRAGS